jgi:hypothetical protein
VVVFFFVAGEASAEAVDVFFVVELFLVVEVAAVEEAVSSFLWAHELRNATVASTAIKVTKDVFIGIG